MAGTLTPTPYQTVLDDDGVAVSGAKIYTYEAGTTTNATTYTTSALSVANANPIVADSAGRYVAYLAAGANLRFIIKTSADVTIDDQDNIQSVPGASVNLDIEGTVGEAVTAGQVLYLSSGAEASPLTAGLWYLTDSDAAPTSTTAQTIGVAVSAIAINTSGTIRLAGLVTTAGAVVVGTTYYVAATPGALTSSAPSFSRQVGVAMTTSTLVLAATTAVAASIPNPISQDLLFTDATYDIGKSGATRPRDLFASRNAVLGGTLDVTGVTTLATVTATQVDVTAEGDLRLQDNTGGEYVGLDAPSAVSGSYTLTFPAAIGAVDQVLSINNTDGTLQWATPETGDITSVVAGAGMTGGGSSGDVTLNVIGTADKVTVSADAVTIASTYIGQTSITTLGTIGTGTWQGTAVADTYVANDLTISGGTVNNSVIGGSVAAAATVTTLDTTGAVTFNDAGSDVDFRVETSANANALNLTAAGLGIFRAADLDYYQTIIAGSFTSGGASSVAAGLITETALTAHSGDTTRVTGQSFTSSITTPAASMTVGIVAQTYINEPTITLGSGSAVTNAATLYVKGAPTEGTNNFAVLAAETTNMAYAIDDGSKGLKYSSTVDGLEYRGYGGHIWMTGTNGADERLRLLSGGGLTFNGDTAAANALDDYEEGTWSPVPNGSSGSAGAAADNLAGTYTKVGRLVVATCYGYFTNLGSWTGDAQITGWPFTHGSGTASYGSIGQFPSTLVDAAMRTAVFPAGGTMMNFRKGSKLDVVVPFSAWTTGSGLAVTISYYA